MQPYNYGTLPDHTRNDTWEGITSIGPILFDGVQPASSLSSCSMHFRTESSLGYKLESSPAAGEGTITISNATTWEVTIPEQSLPLAKGDWLWDFQTTDAAGNVRTLLKGTLTITEDWTHD